MHPCPTLQTRACKIGHFSCCPQGGREHERQMARAVMKGTGKLSRKALCPHKGTLFPSACLCFPGTLTNSSICIFIVLGCRKKLR